MEFVVIGVLLLVAALVVGLLVQGRGGTDLDVISGPDAVGTAAPPEQTSEPPSNVVVVDDAPPASVLDAPEVVEREAEKLSVGERFSRRLSRTRNVLSTGIADLFGRGITDESWDGLEEILITADVGVATTTELVERLRERVREEGVTDAEQVTVMLKQELRAILGDLDRDLARGSGDGPTIWLVTGVNGTGKTTTIGKLSSREVAAGHSVVLAAADTFRAAAADQLGLWADRTGARLVRKDEGADPASVAFDGYLAAKATDADLLIIDTAGRLHNKRDLMDELGKVKRVVEGQAGPIHETLLVLDATTGQNGIAQARAFTEAVNVTGLALTKLDGSSKGGIVIGVQKELGLPVKLVGLGEDVDDLADFDPDAFVDGLFGEI